MSGLYLIARIADRTVAIDTGTVEAVVDIAVAVPIPGAPPAVRGLGALRSRVVTIIDARAAVGAELKADAVGRAVLTKVDGHYYAVLVDLCEDVAPVAGAPAPLSLPLGSGWRSVGCGVIERDGEPVVLIDLPAMIPGMSRAA